MKNGIVFGALVAAAGVAAFVATQQPSPMPNAIVASRPSSQPAPVIENVRTVARPAAKPLTALIVVPAPTLETDTELFLDRSRHIPNPFFGYVKGIQYDAASPAIGAGEGGLNMGTSDWQGIDPIGVFEQCRRGPLVPAHHCCVPLDLDRDGDVDQEDFGLLQAGGRPYGLP